MMNKFNTIILLRGISNLSNLEHGRFEKGSLIMGDFCNPEEIKRYPINDDGVAKRDLANYKCKYVRMAESWHVEEYALQYCQCDSEGEFVQGSDFCLASEE